MALTDTLFKADVSDLTKEGSRDFSLKYHGHKHTFQASNEERDGWVVAIEKAAEEAKGSKEGILGSDKYKDTIGKLSKSPPKDTTRCLRTQMFDVPWRYARPLRSVRRG